MDYGVFSEKYTGEFELSEISDKLEKLVKDDIPNLYENIKELNEEELKNYYEENSSDIEEVFGKKDFDEFKEFAVYIQNTTIDLNSWYKVTIDKDTFENSSNDTLYSYVEYELEFEEGETIDFSLYLAKSKYTTPNYIVNIIY